MDRDLARALAMFDNEFGRLSFGPTRRESPLMPARRGSTDARRNPIPGARRRAAKRAARGTRRRRAEITKAAASARRAATAGASLKRASCPRTRRPSGVVLDASGPTRRATPRRRARTPPRATPRRRAAPPEKRSPGRRRSRSRSRRTLRAPRRGRDAAERRNDAVGGRRRARGDEAAAHRGGGAADADSRLLHGRADALARGAAVRAAGHGKTLLARAVAAQARAAFFSVSPSSLLSKFVGESEKVAKAVYGCARARAPAVVFFDEIDALASRRGASTEHEASRRLKTELLTQIDGISPRAPRS